MKAPAIAILIALLLVPACGAAQKCAEPAHRNDLACAVLNDIVDCTTANAQTLIAQFQGLVLEVITGHTGEDGTIDWAGLLPTVKAFGIADGMCVLVDVVAELQKRSGASGSTSRPRFESVSVGFDRVRAQVAPGIRFKTKRGTI